MSNARCGTMNWKVWCFFFHRLFERKKHKFGTWAWSLPFVKADKADKVSSLATISQGSLYSESTFLDALPRVSSKNLWISLVLHLRMPGFVQGNRHGKAGECVHSYVLMCSCVLGVLCPNVVQIKSAMNNPIQRWPDCLRSWPWLRADLERQRCVGRAW